MDHEDALLAQSRENHERELALLPRPIALPEIERVNAQLAHLAALIPRAEPRKLRGLLSDLGSVEVSSSGVRIVYPPDILPHLAATTVPVPKGGKGLR